MSRSLLVASALLFAPVLFASGASAQDDVGAAEEAICCGGECCLIGGTCFGRGDMNPADSCEVCDPSTSGTAFTPVAGCGATDAGPAPTTDSGPSPAVDAGTGSGDDGGCSVSPGATGHAGMALGLLALGALFIRRRRA